MYKRQDILKNEWVSGASILRVGESVGSFYGYKRLGVYTIEDYEAGNCEKKQIGRAKRSSEREDVYKRQDYALYGRLSRYVRAGSRLDAIINMYVVYRTYIHKNTIK